MRDDAALSPPPPPPPPPPPATAASPPATSPFPPAIAPMREERGDRDAEEWGEGNDDMRAKTRCTTPSAAAAQVTRFTKGAGWGGGGSKPAALDCSGGGGGGVGKSKNWFCWLLFLISCSKSLIPLRSYFCSNLKL